MNLVGAAARTLGEEKVTSQDPQKSIFWGTYILDRGH